MEQAIAELLSHRNVEEAAHTVGISANTLLRWMKEPEFEAAYQEARRKALSQAIARLQNFAGAAVTIVLKIMLDSNVPAGIRLRAAQVVLDLGTRAMEMEDIVARVAELERAAGSAHRSHKPSAILSWPNKKALPGPAINAGADNGE
jgi:hypothetical protein